MLLLSCAAAQTGATATLQHVSAVRDGANLRVEITLSAPVKPSDETAIHPDRILLDFPDTTSDAGNSSVAVNANGVRRVRIARHSESPLITRVVLDLDQAHPYSVTVEENRIIVSIAPAENSRRASRGAPVAATTGNLIGVFRRHRDSKPVMDTPTENSEPIAPPPTIAGPAFEPPADSSAGAAVPAQPAPASQKPSPPATPASDVIQASSTPTPAASAPTQEVATSSPPAVMLSAPPASASAPMEASNVPDPTKTEEAVESATPTPTAAPSVAPITTSTLIARTDDPSLRTVFKVKYVADGVVYLDGGRAQGLEIGRAHV